MSADAKGKAEQGLASLVDTALSVLRAELTTKGKSERGASHRAWIARYVLDVAMDRLPEVDASKPATVTPLTPAAAVSELRKRLSGGNGG